MVAPIDLNQLRAFTAVHGRGSFSAAASELGVPRSTVSRAVASLEEALGLRLFQRTTRQVQATPAGVALFARVAPSLRALDASLRELPEAEETPAGRLRITATADVGTVVLAEAVSRYTTRYPRVQVEMHFDDEVVDLVQGGFELALRVTSRTLRSSSSLTARKLGDLVVQLYASPAYLARRGAPRQPRELAAYDWVSFTGPRPLTRMLDERELRTIEPRVVCRDAFFAREVLRTGGGVGLLPAFLADVDVAAGTLVRVLPRWRLRAGAAYLVQPVGKHRSRRVTAFVELLFELLRQRPLPAAPSV